MACLLVTGATGVVGSALVPELLRDPRASVVLLLRAQDAQDLGARLDRLHAWWRTVGHAVDAMRVEALVGDVCQPLLGLEPSAYDRLTRRLTHVIHAAGNVRLSQPLHEARRSAVDSVRHVLELAARCREAGPFEKLDVLSTVGVAGRMQGVIPEAPLQPSGFHNTYEQAKAEAEQVLWAAMQAGLPATIHRPSMVVGDSRSGLISQYQVFYYLIDFLLGRYTLGWVPRADRFKLDLVPVDYVARAVALACREPQAAGQIFHLCSGPEAAIPLDDLACRLAELERKRGTRLPTRRRLPTSFFRGALHVARPLARGRLRKLLAGMPYFLTYLEDVQVFENAHSRDFFERRGLHLPPPEQYLERVVGCFRQAQAAAAGGRLHGALH
ncbi:MAG: SDR family oxidoreductase [Pirellulales bacterium]|nr:SDR family oxidoreductase [Pirellulales bacterium]